MGFFSSKKEVKKEEIINTTPAKQTISNESSDMIKTPVKNVSTIIDTFKVKADIEGEGSLIIGGIFEGNISITDTLFIEKGAVVSGTIRAKNVKISGELEGTIYSTATEVTASGKFTGLINSNKVTLGGFVDGVIRAVDSVEISSTGVVNSKECKSKNIKIVGRLKGKVVASELLEVISGGSVEGVIITKGIRTEQGGSIIGNIQTYDASIHDKSMLEDEQKEEEISKLINITPEELQKYAKKEDNKVQKRIPSDE